MTGSNLLIWGTIQISVTASFLLQNEWLQQSGLGDLSKTASHIFGEFSWDSIQFTGDWPMGLRLTYH